jgi:hypothetical protein
MDKSSFRISSKFEPKKHIDPPTYVVPCVIDHLLLNFFCNMDDEAQATPKWILQWLFHYITLFVRVLITGTTSLLLAESLNIPQAYHTSILTGEGWVRELLAGHPGCIRCELGVHSHIFPETWVDWGTPSTGPRQIKVCLLWGTACNLLVHQCHWNNNPTCQRAIPAVKQDHIMVCNLFHIFFNSIWCTIIAISNTCSICFTPDMSFYLPPMIQLHLRSIRIPNSDHTSRMNLVSLIAVISTVHLLQFSNCPTETAKVVFIRTVCSDARLICNLSMPILGGRDQQRTHRFMRVLLRMG